MLDLYSHAEFVYPCCASNFTEGQRLKATFSILSPKRRSVDPVGSSLLLFPGRYA
jgi:hypothetical protein